MLPNLDEPKRSHEAEFCTKSRNTRGSDREFQLINGLLTVNANSSNNDKSAIWAKFCSSFFDIEGFVIFARVSLL